MIDSRPGTLIELLTRAVAADPHAEAIRYKERREWVGMTAATFAERIGNVALGLYDVGVRKGDRVAILAESGPLWTISDFAILSGGAVNVPIYPTQPVHQVEYIIREAAPRVLFISTERQMRRVDPALRKFPDLLVVPFQAVSDGENLLPYPELEEKGSRLRKAQPDLLEAISSDVTPGDLASIIYTSGTTGEPKGVMLTHDNIAFNSIASGAFLGIERGNCMLSFLPLSHIFERMVLYLCLYHGVQINYATSIETVANEIREVRPTLMSAVPRLLDKIYARMQKTAADAGGFKKILFHWALGVARAYARYTTSGEPLPPLLRLKHEVADLLVFKKLRAAVGGRLQRMVSGGAALPPHLAEVFIGAGIPVLQGYGLTETSPVISVSTLDQNRIGSVGKPLPGVRVRIDSDGEILTSGPHVFQGYFNKPEDTEAVFVEDATGRWFRTGDIGHLDPDGFLFITDRKKDLIKTSAGKYVAPQMIEGLINQSDFVEQSVVLGDKRKYVIALIVPEFERLRAWAGEQGLDETARDALCALPEVAELLKAEVTRLTAGLADYEKVKKIALLPDEFTIDGGELTPSLKVKRRVVEEKYSDKIESLFH